jgi:dienelactone hydrolase
LRRLLFALAGCAILTGCGSTTRVQLTATPREALIDAPLRVHAIGLEGAATITVTANDWEGKPWTASATYEDGDATPLLSAMLPVGYHGDPRRVGFGFASTTRYRLTLHDGDHLLASTSASRRIASHDVSVRTKTLADAGFIGYFCSRPSPARRPAILALGGSEGGMPGRVGCELLASHGYPTLALAYFGVAGLPPGLEHIRLEYVARGLRWLARQPGVDARKVVVKGSSRGGELALIVGAIYPQLVHGAIGYVPSSVVNPSLVGRGPAWTFRGRPLPFLEIPVERINGPVFVVGGGDDQLWPSGIYVSNVALRMRRHHRTDATELVYPRAGHALAGGAPNHRSATIVRSRYGLLFLGGSPGADARARADSWPKLLQFLARLR